MITPILVVLHLFVFELGARTGQTDERGYGRTCKTRNVAYKDGRIITVSRLETDRGEHYTAVTAGSAGSKECDDEHDDSDDDESDSQRLNQRLDVNFSTAVATVNRVTHRRIVVELIRHI